MSKYIIIDNTVALSEIELSGCYYCRMVDNPQLKNIELVIIYNCHFSNGVTGDFYLIPQTFVRKEADTIEGLCDGLIVEEKENPNNWFIMEIAEFKNKDIEELKYTLNDWVYKCFIKTDKGLIYIAKLNNDGELELI